MQLRQRQCVRPRAARLPGGPRLRLCRRSPAHASERPSGHGRRSGRRSDPWASPPYLRWLIGAGAPNDRNQAHVLPAAAAGDAGIAAQLASETRDGLEPSANDISDARLRPVLAVAAVVAADANPHDVCKFRFGCIAPTSHLSPASLFTVRSRLGRSCPVVESLFASVDRQHPGEAAPNFPF